MDNALMRIAVLFVLLVPAGIGGTGCAGTADAAANVALPPRKEEQLGDEVSEDYEAKENVDLYEGEEVNAYIDRLGQRAVEAAGSRSPEPIDYDFKVIDAPETVNAFAMPGGYIYVYTGLIEQAETEAEVMSVMCHEVAHVTERHIAKSLA
ncbi:MAG: M48 family metalloprotease, partial [Bradymonadaceae bacterium]